MSHFVVPRANELLVRMPTGEGIEGIGIATGRLHRGPQAGRAVVRRC
jgi:hypothetical protein